MNTIETTTNREQLNKLTETYTPDDYMAGCGMDLGQGYTLVGRSNDKWMKNSFNIVGPDGEETGMGADVYGPQLHWRYAIDAEETVIECAYVQWASYGRNTNATEARAFAKAVQVCAGYAEELDYRASQLEAGIREELKAEKEEREAKSKANRAEWNSREVQARPHLGERARVVYGDGKKVVGVLTANENGLACLLDDGVAWTAADNLRTEAQRCTRIDWYDVVEFQVMEPNNRYGTVLEFDVHECD